jgi:hypothetical protein
LVELIFTPTAALVGEHLVELQETMRPHVRAALRTVARASAPRPAAARRAAKDFQQALWPAVWAEVRWAFTPPRTWLMGVVANLVFAVGWLLVQPLTLGRHQDWVVLIGTYFSSWILADVTTTNVFGADHYRVLKALSDGVPLLRILLIKNLALLLIVGLPNLVAAVVLTLWLETPSRLAVIIPTVAVPLVSWLGVGNLFSVLHPVTVEPLLRRWRQRRDRRRTRGWIAALTLPYALYYVADPMNGVEHNVLWTQVPALIWPVFGRDTKSFVHLAIGVGVWIGGTIAALLWVRKRGLQLK